MQVCTAHTVILKSTKWEVECSNKKPCMHACMLIVIIISGYMHACYYYIGNWRTNFCLVSKSQSMGNWIERDLPLHNTGECTENQMKIHQLSKRSVTSCMVEVALYMKKCFVNVRILIFGVWGLRYSFGMGTHQLFSYQTRDFNDFPPLSDNEITDKMNNLDNFELD